MANLSRKELLWVSRTLATMLEAGLPISRVLDVLARQAKSSGGRRAFSVARDRIEQGATLAEALQAQHCFPPFFVQLVDMGERSGALEKTARQIVRYYEFRQRVWSKFIARTMLPVLQYVIAVAVICFALHLLATLSNEPSRLGLWLSIGYGAPVVLVGVYWLLSRVLGGTRLIHELILQVPVLGQAARQLALAQFSLVLYVLYEAAFPIVDAVKRALVASGNAAFAARADRAARVVEESGSLTDALRAAGVFPAEYLDVLSVAEESGMISERLDWLATHHAERAERAMAALVTALGWAIYATVGAIIIVFIFRFFMRYIGGINSAMP